MIDVSGYPCNVHALRFITASSERVLPEQTSRWRHRANGGMCHDSCTVTLPLTLSTWMERATSSQHHCIGLTAYGADRQRSARPAAAPNGAAPRHEVRGDATPATAPDDTTSGQQAEESSPERFYDRKVCDAAHVPLPCAAYAAGSCLSTGRRCSTYSLFPLRVCVTRTGAWRSRAHSLRSLHQRVLGVRLLTLMLCVRCLTRYLCSPAGRSRHLPSQADRQLLHSVALGRPRLAGGQRRRATSWPECPHVFIWQRHSVQLLPAHRPPASKARVLAGEHCCAGALNAVHHGCSNTAHEPADMALLRVLRMTQAVWLISNSGSWLI